MGRKSARALIARGEVSVDGEVVEQHDQDVTHFARVLSKDQVIQEGCKRLCIMLYKPAGVLSATKDDQFQTVLDLIDHPEKESLHLAGRLDRASTGLILLTNDGAWSKALTRVEKKVPKVYLVETSETIDADVISKFAEGFYFHTEGIQTQPAELNLLEDRKARVTLYEGKYHQIKRMFHRVNNRVLTLHRVSIGRLVLPQDWVPGCWKLLSDEEIGLAQQTGDPQKDEKA